jgi:hypothetical protein
MKEALIMFAVKFGLEAAILLGERIMKPGATIDDAITALKEIQTKTPQDFIDEARARAGQTPTV